MKERMKSIKWGMYVAAILSIIVGILFMVFPAGSEMVIVIIIGISLGILALTVFISSIMNKAGSMAPGIIFAIILAVLAIIIIVNPGWFTTFLVIFIGFMMIFHGIQMITTSFVTKSMGVNIWWIMLVVGIISLVLGVICAFSPFAAITLTGVMIGIMLVYDGVASIITTITSARKAKSVNGDKVVNSKVIK